MRAHAISFLFLLIQNYHLGLLHSTLLSILSTYGIYFSHILFFFVFLRVSCNIYLGWLFFRWLFFGWLLLGCLLLGRLLLEWLLPGWLLLRWLLLSIFADFEQVKKANSKTPLGETGCLFIFCLGHCLMSSALHPSFSDLAGSPPVLSSTPTLVFFVFECIAIQFFNSLTCDLRDAMPCQWSLTLIPRVAEDFPRGDNHSKHAPLPTYLAWLQ